MVKYFFKNLNLPSTIDHKRNYMENTEYIYRTGTEHFTKSMNFQVGNGEIECIVGIPNVLYLGLIFLKTQRIRSGVMIPRENLKTIKICSVNNIRKR